MRASRQGRAGPLSVLTGPLEGEAGSRELGAGSREASEIRMLNHWAAGLRSGLLPEVCGVATPEMCKKKTNNIQVCLILLMRGTRECFFEWLWGVLPGVAELFC